MSISITFVIVMIMAIMGLYYGGNRGFAKCLSGFFAIASTVLVMGILLKMYFAYTKGQTVDLLVACVALVALGVIYGALKLITKAVTAVSNLPVIGIIDKAVGAIVGFGLAVLVFQVVVLMASIGTLGSLGSRIIQDVNGNLILSLLMKYDMIGIIVAGKEWFQNQVR